MLMQSRRRLVAVALLGCVFALPLVAAGRANAENAEKSSPSQEIEPAGQRVDKTPDMTANATPPPDETDADAPILARPEEPAPALKPAPVESTDLAPAVTAPSAADAPDAKPAAESETGDKPEEAGKNPSDSRTEAPATPEPSMEQQAAKKAEADETAKPVGEGAAATATQDTATDPTVTAVLELLTKRRAAGAKTDAEAEEAIAGFYAAEAEAPLWTGDAGLNARARSATDFIRQADDWGLKADQFKLPSLPDGTSTLEQRAAAEVKLSEAVLLYARHARGGRLNPKSVSRLLNHEPEFADPLELLKLLASTEDATAQLKALHPPHPQFHKLREALVEARAAEKKADADAGEKPAVSADKILANMERWRWMPRDLGEFYVWDDVPAQMASVYSGDKRVFHERMVVGKPSTPTPMFSDEMEYIIFHPSWGVPPGMKRNELLPQLRNTNGGWFSSKPLASAVLRSHGLRVTRGGVPVNPDSIDWSKVNIHSYSFTQPPGPTNVLGVVKFRFPNRHNVYMHDTPERNLFAKRDRTFSHGCMRIQNPIRLAEVLLEHDKGWDADEVQRQKRRGGHITLDNPIPVHIAYFTVVADDEGKLDQRGDLYGIDRRLASKLVGHKVTLRGSKVSSKRLKPKKRTAYRKKRRASVRQKKEKPWNPFNSLID